MSTTSRMAGGLIAAVVVCTAMQANAVPRATSTNDDPTLGVLDEIGSFPVINSQRSRLVTGNGTELNATVFSPGDINSPFGIPAGFACATDTSGPVPQCTQDFDILLDVPYVAGDGALEIETFSIFGNSLVPNDTVRFRLFDDMDNPLRFDVVFDRAEASGGGVVTATDVDFFDISTDTDSTPNSPNATVDPGPGALVFAGVTNVSRLIVDFLDNGGGGAAFGRILPGANPTLVPLPASALLLLGGLGALAARARRRAA